MQQFDSPSSPQWFLDKFNFCCNFLTNVYQPKCLTDFANLQPRQQPPDAECPNCHTCMSQELFCIPVYRTTTAGTQKCKSLSTRSILMKQSNCWMHRMSSLHFMRKCCKVQTELHHHCKIKLHGYVQCFIISVGRLKVAMICLSV